MHFHVLNILLIVLLVAKQIESIKDFKDSNFLNEVSDFNDIVEINREHQNSENQNIKEDDSIKLDFASKRYQKPEKRQQKKFDGTLSDDSADDIVFSSTALSVSNSLSECPKHDIKNRDSNGVPLRLKLVPQEEDMGSSDSDQPQSIRILPKQGEHNDQETVVIKENVNIGKKVPEQKYKKIIKENVIPDYVYDFDNTKDDSCKECKNIKGLYPIPLLESILINKLLESNEDNSKPYPIKYVIKAVLPNFKNVDELNNPQAVKYLKNYLHRRKRQLEFLEKRSSNRLKRKTRKKKKNALTSKERPYRSANETNNDHYEGEIHNMIEYIAKNKTFNDTFTYMPLVFGTVSPAEDQMLVAGVKQNSSAEEKCMLLKILSIQPGGGTTPSNSTENQKSGSALSSVVTGTEISPSSQILNGTTISNNNSTDHQNSTEHCQTGNVQQSTAVHEESTLQTTENVTFNLNLNLHDPKVRKSFIEVMQRQQKVANYQGSTYRLKREAENITTVASLGSSSSAGSSLGTSSVGSSSVIIDASNLTNNQSTGSTESGTLGLVVTSPQPPTVVNELPGILIYPKNIKQHKRFANSGISPTLSQDDISDLLKSIGDDGNISTEKSNKNCKTDDCMDETDKIMGMLSAIKQDSIKADEDSFIDYTSSSPHVNQLHTDLNAESGIISSSVSKSKVNAETLDSTDNVTVSVDNEKNAFKQSPAIKEKLTKLQKDLKMVDEIQNIFNGVANAKREHQNAKRDVANKNNKIKIKHPDAEVTGNKFDSILNEFIKARILQRTMKNNSEFKSKRNNFGKSRARRFLAMG